MTPVLVSVDKAGDLKIGRKKCRLYKKDEVVKVAKKYGINTEKKTVGELCGAIKSRAKSSPMNNIPLAKLYPEVAKKRAAAKKRVEKKALDRKIAANFMRNMTTRIPLPRPKPRSPNRAAVARKVRYSTTLQKQRHIVVPRTPSELPNFQTCPPYLIEGSHTRTRRRLPKRLIHPGQPPV
jgi:hypothetical protein